MSTHTTAAEPRVVDTPTKVTVTVNLPTAMAVDLRSWAAEQGKTFTQALKEAVALKLFIEEELGQGNRLLIERSNGSQREIHFQ